MKMIYTFLSRQNSTKEVKQDIEYSLLLEYQEELKKMFIPEGRRKTGRKIFRMRKKMKIQEIEGKKVK